MMVQDRAHWASGILSRSLQLASKEGLYGNEDVNKWPASTTKLVYKSRDIIAGAFTIADGPNNLGTFTRTNNVYTGRRHRPPSLQDHNIPT